MKINHLGSLFFLAAFVLQTTNTWAKQKPQELFQQAQQAAQGKQFDKAVELALEVAALYRSDNTKADEWIEARLYAANYALEAKDYSLVDIKNLLDESYEKLPIAPDDQRVGRITLFQAWFLANQLTDYYNAKEAYEKTRRLIEQAGEAQQITARPGYDVYKPLAQIYTRLGENEKAVAMMSIALQKMKKNGQEYFLPELYGDWGIIYGDLGEHQRAIYYFDEGLEAHLQFWGTTPPADPRDLESFKNMKGLLLTQKANALFNQQKITAAQKLCNEALLLLNWEDYKAAALMVKGELIASQEGLVNAEAYFTEAIELARSYFPPYSRTIAKMENQLAAHYREVGRYEEALELAHRALARILPEMKGQETYALPDESSFYPENTIMEALAEKGRIYFEWYQEKADLEKLQLAEANLSLAIDMEGIINKVFTYKSSWLTMAEMSHNRHEVMLDILYELYSQTKDPAYLSSAFQFMEKSRAVVLNRALASQRAAALLDDQLMLEEEKALQIQLSDYKRLLVELQLENASGQQLADVEQQINKLKLSMDSLVNEIQNTFPNYYQAKYNYSVPTLADLNEQLNKHSLFVEYFLGQEDSTLYIFSIEKDRPANFIQQKLPKDFAARFSGFLKSLKDWEFVQNNEGNPAVFQAFCDQSRQFYKLLFPQGIHKPSHQQLLLIPDNVLSFLPFDVLMVNDYEAAEADYGALPYLIKDAAIQYAFSASSLFSDSDNSSEQAFKNYLGVAPQYGSSSYLPPVTHNTQAIEGLKAKFRGELLKDKQATIAEFKQQVKNVKILHFYGHAKAYPEDPESSWLAFSHPTDKGAIANKDSNIPGDGLLGAKASIPSEEIDRLLFLFELYQLDLNAELTVLSACETGIGKVALGEGVISLARAFRYAGCPSTLMTLWEANDYRGEVAFLMEKFFDYLVEEKMTKDQAIRQAKLDYLNTPGKSRHPAYWASFVLVGDNTPVELNNNRRLFYWLLAIVAGVFLFFVRNWKN